MMYFILHLETKLMVAINSQHDLHESVIIFSLGL